MSKVKTIYLEDEMITEIMTNAGNLSFSERVRELISKGLKYEQGTNDLSIRDLITALGRAYNKKSKEPIVL